MNMIYAMSFSNYYGVFVVIFLALLFAIFLTWVSSNDPYIRYIVDQIMKSQKAHMPRGEQIPYRRGVRPPSRICDFNGNIESEENEGALLWANMATAQDSLRQSDSSDCPCPLSVRRANYDMFVEKMIQRAHTFKAWTFIYVHARSRKHCKLALKRACDLANTKKDVRKLSLLIVKFGGDRFEGIEVRKDCEDVIWHDLYYLVRTHREKFDQIFAGQVSDFYQVSSAS